MHQISIDEYINQQTVLVKYADERGRRYQEKLTIITWPDDLRQWRADHKDYYFLGFE